MGGVAAVSAKGNSSPIEIIFDYDNVLAKTETIALTTCFGVVAKYFKESHGITIGGFDDFLKEHVGKTARKIFTTIAQANQITINDETLDSLALAEKKAVMAELEKTLQPDPMVLEVLTYLKNKGVVMAVASSSAPDRLMLCIKTTGQTEFFPEDLVFSAQSQACANPKPAPDVYNLASGHLAKILADPTEPQIITVEDSPSGFKSSCLATGVTINIAYLGAYPENERTERASKLWAIAEEHGKKNQTFITSDFTVVKLIFEAISNNDSNSLDGLRAIYSKIPS